MKEFIIQIFGVIGQLPMIVEMFGEGKSFTLSQLEDELKALKPNQPIRVKINSGGGSVTEGFGIYDRLVELKAKGHKITTEVLGLCGSMATVIALSADKDNREMHKNSEYFIHNPFWTPNGGEGLEADEVKAISEELKSSEIKILDTYVAQTGSEKNRIKKLMDAKKSLTAEQAEELGFIGKIIGEEVNAFERFPIMCFVDKKKAVKEDKNGIQSVLDRLDAFGKKIEKAFSGRQFKKKGGMSFADWLNGQDDTVTAGIVEAIGQDAFDQIASGDMRCPSMDEIDSIASVTGDDSQTLIDVAMSDGCEYDIQGAKKKLDAKKDKEIADLKRKIAELEGNKEDEEKNAMKQELEELKGLVLAIKPEEGAVVDGKEKKTEGKYSFIKKNISSKKENYHRA